MFTDHIHIKTPIKPTRGHHKVASTLQTRPARPAEGARELSMRGTSVVDEGHLSLEYLFEGGL
jgi:hypothetical protein